MLQEMYLFLQEHTVMGKGTKYVATVEPDAEPGAEKESAEKESAAAKPADDDSPPSPCAVASSVSFIFRLSSILSSRAPSTAAMRRCSRKLGIWQIIRLISRMGN